MVRKLYLGVFLFLCASIIAFGGCDHRRPAEIQSSDTSFTIKQESPNIIPEEIVQLFSFIVPGKTMIQEVYETVPYTPVAIATTDLNLCYHLPDGIDVFVYYDRYTLLVEVVVLELADGSRCLIKGDEVGQVGQGDGSLVTFPVDSAGTRGRFSCHIPS